MIDLKFQNALEWAARAHDGHYRKGSLTPYITHPVAVAFILAKQGCGGDVVIAGLLHDTVEDTQVTLAEIEGKFGAEVAAIVEGCSEPDKTAPWHARKQHTINTLAIAPLSVKYVACADKLHNFATMQRDSQRLGQTFWQRFNQDYEQQKWYAHAVTKSLLKNINDDSIKPMFIELETLVKKFFI